MNPEDQVSADDANLLEQFVRVVPVGNELHSPLWLEVCTVEWPDPHTPRERWHSLLPLPAHASAEAVERAKHAALDDPRYFAICERCQHRHPTGWMHSESLCQSCAERWLGVQY